MRSLVSRKQVLGWAVAVALVACPGALVAGGGGGSGGGGGGKVLTVKYTGIVTEMHQSADGVYVTVGNLYYNTGTALVTSDTKVVIDGANGSIFDLEIGDIAAITATYAGVALKVENQFSP